MNPRPPPTAVIGGIVKMAVSPFTALILVPPPKLKRFRWIFGVAVIDPFQFDGQPRLNQDHGSKARNGRLILLLYYCLFAIYWCSASTVWDEQRLVEKTVLQPVHGRETVGSPLVFGDGPRHGVATLI